MALGKKTGGRVAGTPNAATAEVRALASEYGPAAIEELARLAAEAESESCRVVAINSLLDRGYGKSPLSQPIHIELPDTSTPAGVIWAMAAIVQAVSKGEISPADGHSMTAIIDAQRRAIELGDHEDRLKRLEALGRG
jgi:hypothetical protein